MGLPKEGIQQARQALEIFEWLGDTVQQAQCSADLASSLLDDNQLNAAEEAASRAIDLLPEIGEQFLVCGSHIVLGKVYRSKGETEKTIHHEGKLEDAQAHVECAKLHAVNNAYNSGLAVYIQAMIWCAPPTFMRGPGLGLRRARRCVEIPSKI